MNLDSSNLLAKIVAAIFVALPSTALPYNFEPTDGEFLSWPKYCQVAYVQTNIGGMSKWSRQITQLDVSLANQVLGGRARGGIAVHHFCAGSAWLNRGRLEFDPVKKAFRLRRAAEETIFTLERTPPNHQLYATIATQLASVRVEQGESQKALELLEQTISSVPDSPIPYLAKAVIYHRQGKYELARETLLAADRRVGGESVEIHYFLGLTFLKLGEPETAVPYARQAYQQGYPLDGLKRQLQESGYWESASQ